MAPVPRDSARHSKVPIANQEAQCCTNRLTMSAKFPPWKTLQWGST